MGFFDKLLGKKEEPVQGRITEKNSVYAPVAGKLILLADFPDEVFREGVLGQGCGIQPSEEIIKAPCNGQVIRLQDSQHALGLLSEDGVELLIHVGVDTVCMNGKGFHALVKKGDRVIRGQDLLKFSRDDIQRAGLNPAVAVIVTNSDDYSSFNVAAPGDVSVNFPIITLD